MAEGDDHRRPFSAMRLTRLWMFSIFRTEARRPSLIKAGKRPALRPGQKSAIGLALALLCLLTVSVAPAQAQPYSPVPGEAEEAEYEALVEALDELGLNLDDPELENTGICGD